MSTLSQLVDDLRRGALHVVDLTQPLGPSTPVIGLPPVFAASPGVTPGVEEHPRAGRDAPVPRLPVENAPRREQETRVRVDVRHDVDHACRRDEAANRNGVARVLRQVASGHTVNRRVEVRAGVLAECQRIPVPRRAAIVVPRDDVDRSRRGDPAAFLNAAADGPHSPGFDPAASRMLADERDILGVGVESIGADAGQAGRFDPPFPNHTIMHGAGRFGLASLCNLDQLPPTGAIVIAAPLKIVGGSGSPVRVIAIAPA